MCAGVGWLDSRQPAGLTLSLAYLLPIALSTWFVWRWMGVLVSFLSASLCLTINLTSYSRPYHPVAAWWNALTLLGFYLIMTWVLSALQRSLSEQRAQARTDVLTGMSNRRDFYERAQVEVEQARRHRRALTLAYVDLDDFKSLNDCFGHQAGDACLSAVADTMRTHVRAEDLVARLGGDEFAILLPEAPVSAVTEALGKLHEALKKVMRARGWGITFSIGAMTFLEPPASVDEMIQQADALMYAVKGNGKDGIRLETAPSGIP